MSCKDNPGIRIGISLLVTLLFSIGLIFALASVSASDTNKLSVNQEEVLNTEKPTTIPTTTTTTSIKEVVSDVVKVSTVNNQESDTNPNNQTKVVDSPKNTEPKTMQQKVSIYKNSLNITKTEWVKVRVVNELIERRSTNYTAFNKIVNASKMFEDTEDKEILTDELLGMDENFVDNISDDIMSNRERVKDQVRDYVNSVKIRKQVNVIIDENQVKDLFNRETAMEDLIDSIWGSI